MVIVNDLVHLGRRGNLWLMPGHVGHMRLEMQHPEWCSDVLFCFENRQADSTVNAYALCSSKQTGTQKYLF